MLNLDQLGQWLGLMAAGLMLAAGVEFAQNDAGARTAAPLACAAEYRPSVARGAAKRVAGSSIQAGIVRGLASPECR